MALHGDCAVRLVQSHDAEAKTGDKPDTARQDQNDYRTSGTEEGAQDGEKLDITQPDRQPRQQVEHAVPVVLGQ